MKWRELRAKYLFAEQEERAGDRELPLLSVSAYRGVVPRSDLTADEARADDLSRYKVCAAGDVVINRMSAYQGAAGVAPIKGLVSPDYTVLRATRGVSSGFLGHLIRSRWFTGQISARLRGIGGIDQGNVRTPRINTEDLGNIVVRIPPFSEQTRIADFLDAETARIDALIEKKCSLLNLLSVRRDAGIGEAIDSCDGEALSLRRVVEAFVDYRGATPAKAESGVPLVTATNVSDGEIDFSLGEQFLTEETYTDWMRRGFPEVGDVLLTTEAPLGEVAMITHPRVALAQRIILLKPDRQLIHPEFLYASLRSRRVQADLLSRASGSTVWGIRADRLREVQLQVPSMPDQERVVAVSQRVEAQYRRARRLLDQQADVLWEHRQALTTAAVTGQLEIAEAVA